MAPPMTGGEDMDQDMGASFGTGSRASTEPASSLGPPGVDPSRWIEQAIATMGNRIEARRKAMGLTLDQVATRAGMSKSYIWEIENGKNKNPTIRTAWQLSAALGWTLSECIGVWEHTALLHPDAMRIAIQVDILLRPTTANRTDDCDCGKCLDCDARAYHRDSDGSPEGGDACGSVHDSAGLQGIAQ